MPLQCSTQWDDLGHIFDHGVAWNGRPAGDVVTSLGDAVTGIKTVADIIAGRAVLLLAHRRSDPRDRRGRRPGQPGGRQVGTPEPDDRGCRSLRGCTGMPVPPRREWCARSSGTVVRTRISWPEVCSELIVRTAGTDVGDRDLARPARRAFRQDAGDRLNTNPLRRERWRTTAVTAPHVLLPVDEAAYVSTNGAAQYGLAAIQNLALIADAPP